MTFTLRPHQISAADEADVAFAAGRMKILFDLCVASGKSYTYAECARRAWMLRGERTLIVAHRSELVEQNAAACRALGLQVGINSATLDQRTWRAPVISAQIQSVYRSGSAFGPIGLMCADEAHLFPHDQSGMFRELYRGLGQPRLIGGSGTPFRMFGGSLTEGEGAPFEQTVYHYNIMDGIRDGYLVPPYSAPVDDKIDVTKLRVRQGEYTSASSDDQTIAAMDNHIAQMLYYGKDRRCWLVFEASIKSATAMCKRMNEWGIRTGLVLGSKSKADEIARRRALEQLRKGELKALVNVDCLTTGTDVQEIDMVVCRRRTKSLSLWLQIIGRLLRTIGGNIVASTAAGKPDGLLLDFADNTTEFGPLDFIRPKDTVLRMVSCESCSARNAGAAMRCWACDEPMTKLCPSCLGTVVKGTLDCPTCGYDMRTGSDGAGREPQKLLETPTGAALISSYSKGKERDGGWLPIRKVHSDDERFIFTLESGALVEVAGVLATHAAEARWIREDGTALLKPNGSNRNTVLHVAADGVVLPIPMPPYSN